MSTEPRWAEFIQAGERKSGKIDSPKSPKSVRPAWAHAWRQPERVYASRIRPARGSREPSRLGVADEL